MLRIKEICNEQGINIKDLAKRMDISAPTLSAQINGNPQLSTLTKIADALGVHISELFETPSDLKIIVEYEGESTRLTEKDIIEVVKQKKNKK